MKVLMVNGSPNEKGCTYTALNEVASTLNEEGIETEIYHIGADPISGCTACYNCRKIGRCIIDDQVNEFVDIAKAADGFVFASPVHYASATGSLISFMDRAFFSDMGSFIKKVSTVNVIGSSLAGAILFFVVTNFSVWLTSGFYEYSFAGLVNCFDMAIPFFRNTLSSALIYSAVMFGSYELLSRMIPELKAIEVK